MNTSEIQIDERFFCLFKGDPGSGKSVAAGSFPNPYFMDNDGRMKSVVNYWRPRGKEFEYDRFDTPLECNKRLEEFVPYCPFKTLVYDGVTTGSRQMLRIAKLMRGIGDPATVGQRNRNKTEQISRKYAGGIELSQIEDYNVETEWFETIINNLKYISFHHNVNVVVTAHILSTEEKDIKTRLTTVSRSLMTGGKKVAAALPVHFDEAYHFDVQPAMDGSEPRYTVLTRNTGWDWAKTALPIDTRIDFTDGSLYDLIVEQIRRSKLETISV